MKQPVLYPMLTHNRYMLWLEYIVMIRVQRKKRNIKIPCRFITDGASIPRPFWTVAGSPFQPQFITAAIIHDWMYREHSLMLKSGRFLPVTRRQADNVYRDILKINGVNRYLRNKHYYALRACGIFAWRKQK